MPRSLVVRTILPAAAALSLVGQPALAAGLDCWNSDELPAAQLHAFHTALMVGALKCRSERPDVMNSYNAFVQARKSSIDAARTILQARFIRELGPEMGLTEFKNFDTEIANRTSIDGPDELPCDGVDTYSRLAASASQGDLFTLARLNNPNVEIRSCGSEPTPALVDASKTAGSEAPEQAGPLPVVVRIGASPAVSEAMAASTPAAHEEPGSATPPEMQAVAQTKEIIPETPPQGSVAVETAAPDATANVDPAKALEDAARALAAAATSLRTASSTSQ